MKIWRAMVGLIQTNCYLVADDQKVACVIDPGGDAERVARIAKDEGLTVTHILLTHGHPDHLGGAAELVALTGAILACAPEVAPMLRDPDEYASFPEFLGTPKGEPNLLLHEGDVVKVGDLEVKVWETPGHSPGDLTFDIDGSLFCGDLIFYRSIGRTDLRGGDYDRLISSIQKLVDHYPPEAPVLPGHMQTTTLGSELQANPFMRGMKPRG